MENKEITPEYRRLRRKCIEQRDKFEKNLTEEQIKQQIYTSKELYPKWHLILRNPFFKIYKQQLNN